MRKQLKYFIRVAFVGSFVLLMTVSFALPPSAPVAGGTGNRPDPRIHEAAFSLAGPMDLVRTDGPGEKTVRIFSVVATILLVETPYLLHSTAGDVLMDAVPLDSHLVYTQTTSTRL